MPIMQTVIQGGGTTPTGTIQITTNGTHDVTSYATADVQVPTTAPAMYVEKTKDGSSLKNGGMYINLTGITTIEDNVLNSASTGYTGQVTLPDFSSITTIKSNGCSRAFNGCTGLTGNNINLSSLTNIGAYGCYYMFNGCTGLTGSVDMSSLQRMVGGQYYRLANMFTGCTGLTGSVNMSSLVEISEASNCCDSMFSYSGISSIDLSKLQRIATGNCCRAMFSHCTNLTTVKLDSLENLYSAGTSYTATEMFSYCSSLQNNPFINTTAIQADCDSLFSNSGLVDGSFNKLVYLKSRFSYTYNGCTNLQKLDFPALARISVGNYGTPFNQYFINGCTNLTRIDYPMLTILQNNTTGGFSSNCFAVGGGISTLEVHFRKDMQTTISALSNFSTKWGAGDIIFDLVGTITVNGNQYRREGVCNENGYIAWQKVGSTVTINNEQYNFDTADIEMLYGQNVFYPNKLYGALYIWKTADGTKSAYLHTLQPEVGSFAFTGTSATTPTLEITAVNNEFVYTVDSAEPEVGDTVYSDTGTTVVGTISAIA